MGQIMARIAKRITCTEDERTELERLANGQKTEARMVERARIILGCLDGREVMDVAEDVGTRPNTVIKWRDRFMEAGLPGLADNPRAGRPETHGEGFLKSVLEVIDTEPPEGCTVWDGGQIAERLGCGKDAVWKVLRDNNINLARKRTWCVSTDPEFARKAADVVGLYLDPPTDAIVVSVDEKPQMQARSCPQGYVYTRSHEIERACRSTYKRNGTLNLFAALEIATGKVKGETTRKKTRADFTGFMDQVVSGLPRVADGSVELHVIMDNYCIHKRCDEWLGAHPNVHFHYTPTSASWLNMVEIWFNILGRKVLRNGSFNSTDELAAKIREYIDAANGKAHPFVWRKRDVHGAELSNTIANLRN